MSIVNASHNKKMPMRFSVLKDEISEKGMLFIFLLPALAFLLIAQAYPLFYSLYLSFIDFTLAKSTTPGGFVGFDNYIKAFQDEVFRQAIGLSLKFALTATLFEVAFGLLLAYLLIGEKPWTRLWET